MPASAGPRACARPGPARYGSSRSSGKERALSPSHDRPAAFDPHGHPVVAYELAPTRPAPPGVPSSGPSAAHAERPFAPTYAARRAAFLEHVRASPPPRHLAAVFHELARLAAGGPAHLGVFEAALDYVDARLDCADFVVHGVLRLVLQFGGDPRLPPALLARAERTLVGFKYGPDERADGRRDSLCTWTENHQVLFAAAALLAGERHPQARFPASGRSGREQAALAARRLRRWLDLRFRTGFSEWLSNFYSDPDLVALLSLADFAADPELRARAAIVADLVLVDLALHHFRGVHAATRGRSYERGMKWAAEESTTDTARLVLGTGRFARIENMAAPCLALSPRYRPPALVAAIAADAERPAAAVRQRMGIRLDELPRWGLDPARDEDAFALLSLEAYADPRTIGAFVRLLDRFDWWRNDFFAPFARVRGLLAALRRLRLLPLVARAFAWDLARNLRPEVDVLTFRTPDYQLSAALDWRPGRGGDQAQAWQATLGPDAVCFTTHPGDRAARSPGWWTGSATLPRVGQVANVAIVLYRLRRRPALHVPTRHFVSHAWLPRDRFDEVREQAGWVFARRGDGYLALRSRRPARWNEDPAAGEDRGRELVAAGRDHAWICELGRRADDGPFARFVERIAAAPLSFVRGGARYRSPSRGWIELGWRGPLRHEGRAVPLRGGPRYDTPWGAAPFPMESLALRCGAERLRLDWEPPAREGAPPA